MSMSIQSMKLGRPPLSGADPHVLPLPPPLFVEMHPSLTPLFTPCPRQAKKKMLQPHPRASGRCSRRRFRLLDEFAMMWAFRERFPLHYVLFKQTACHISREANVERLFSRAGNLSDPNIDTHVLATLTRIGFNRFAYESSWEAIKAAYYAKYRVVEDPDDVLELDGSSSPASAPGVLRHTQSQNL